MAYQCSECGFELWLPVWDDSYTAVGLYDDARFPGRSLVVLREHWEHFDELPRWQLRALDCTMMRVGTALRGVIGASRVNYAILGNAVPHLHAHVVPRFPSQEPAPERPPWEDPRERDTLGQRIPDLISTLQSQLAA